MTLRQNASDTVWGSIVVESDSDARRSSRRWVAPFIAFSFRSGTVLGALALHVFVSRALPIVDAGVVFLLIVWIGALSIIVRLGLDGYFLVLLMDLSLARPSAELQKLVLRLLGLVLMAGSLGGFIAFGGVFISTSAAATHPNVHWSVLLAVSFAMVPYSLSIINTSLHKTLGQQWMANFIEAGGGSLLTLVLMAVWSLVFDGVALTDALLCLLGGYVWMWFASSIVLFFGLRKLHRVDGKRAPALGRRDGHVPVPPLRRALSESFPFMGASALAYLLLWLPGLAMGWTGRLDDVSRFNAIVRIGSLVVFGLSVANAFAAPLIARLYRQEAARELQKVAWNVADSSFIFGVVSFVGALLFGSGVLGFFGSAYSASALGLAIYCAGQLINAFTGASTYLLQLTGSSRNAFMISFTVFVTIGVLGAASAAIWGYLAAVVGSATTVAVYNLAIRRAVKRFVGVESNPKWFSVWLGTR